MRATPAALLAAAVLGLVPATAGAVPGSERCDYDSFSQEAVTGDGLWDGVAFGYVQRDATDDVAISCVVKVNGTTVAATPAGTGRGVAVTAGRVTFAAGDTDDVELCRVVTVNGATTETCPGRMYWPPEDFSLLDPVFEAVDDALAPVDAALCADGDVYAAGVLVWDCAPYGLS